MNGLHDLLMVYYVTHVNVGKKTELISIKAMS